MAKSRTQTLLILVLLGAGALAAAILGLNVYMRATAVPLHPDPRGVPARSYWTPSEKWSGAVEQARQVVRTALAGQNLPGVSVAIGVDGGLAWAEGFGWADLEHKVEVGPNTRFRIGTASTVLTSAAVGLLLEKGSLRLDDEIQAHVPAFPKKEWPVTLRHLMAHTAGVRTDGGDEGPLFAERCARPVEALEFFADRELLFEPGTQFRYSSYGWILVSAAVEAAAGRPFLAFMQEHVFDPLDMDATVPDSSDPLPDRATPYFPRFAADPSHGLHLMRPLEYSCYAGASVFLSTPSDLVRFGMAMNDGTLLQPATIRTLQAPQRLPSGEETGYGLGWDLETVTIGGQPLQAAGHDGDTLGGRVATLMTLRDRRIVVAVTSNISYADTGAIAAGIANAFAAAQEQGGARR